jgi:hypothetical protein
MERGREGRRRKRIWNEGRGKRNGGKKGGEKKGRIKKIACLPF